MKRCICLQATPCHKCQVVIPVDAECWRDDYPTRIYCSLNCTVPGPERWTGPTPAGELGIESSHKHAEADDPGWTETAACALRDYFASHGECTIEHARVAVTLSVGEPDELRAWGAVTQMAQRRKWIEPTGSYQSAVSINGSAKPVYRGVQ